MTSNANVNFDVKTQQGATPPPVSSGTYGIGSLSGNSYSQMAAIISLLMQCIEDNLAFSQGSINTEFASMTAAKGCSFRGAEFNLIKSCVEGAGQIIAGSLSLINTAVSRSQTGELEGKLQDAQNQLKSLRENYDPLKIEASGTGTGDLQAATFKETFKNDLKDGAFKLDATLTNPEKDNIKAAVGHMKGSGDQTEFNAYKEQFKRKETDLISEANTYQTRISSETQNINLGFDFGKQATQGVAQSIGGGMGYVANQADTLARSYGSQEQVAAKQGSATDQNTQSLAGQIQALQQALNAMYSAG